MSRATHRGLTVLVLWTGLCAQAGACTLVLSEHRSGRLLMQLPLSPNEPAFDIDFTHSVLGTAVTDRYRWRAGPGGGRAHLREEWFEGEGYGLPAVAGPGEQLERVDSAPGTQGPRWRLRTDRPVEPLVVRPLPAQQMRVTVPGLAPVLLGSLSTQAVLLQAQGCPPSP